MPDEKTAKTTRESGLSTLHLALVSTNSRDRRNGESAGKIHLTVRLPILCLLIVDMGFFAFLFFDALSAANKRYLTRLTSNTRYELVRPLFSKPSYRDKNGFFAARSTIA